MQSNRGKPIYDFLSKTRKTGICASIFKFAEADIFPKSTRLKQKLMDEHHSQEYPYVVTFFKRLRIYKEKTPIYNEREIIAKIGAYVKI